MSYTANQLIRELTRGVQENPELGDLVVSINIDGTESPIENIDLWASGGIQLEGEE